MNLELNSTQKVLVLGSAGQIGSALVPFLRNLKFDVSTYDIAVDPVQDLRTWPNAYLEGLIHNADYVFFLAFDVGGSHYLERYQDTFQFSNNNLKIMSNTFSLLEKHGTPFLFASSQMATMSYSNYGLLKQIGKKMARSIGGRVVHFWNVYGYESDSSKYHVISDFINSALNRKVIEMRTTGQESRDFLYVLDCCEALKVVMDKHQVFPTEMKLHISTGVFSKIIEVADIISQELGAKVIPGSKNDEVQRDAKNLPDLSLQEYWKPKTTLKSGIIEIIEKMRVASN